MSTLVRGSELDDTAASSWPRGPVVAAVILLLIIGWLFWDFFSRQYLWATRYQADWGHTLVVPLIAAYFVYFKRKEILAKPFKTSWLGIVPIVLGVAWYMFCTIGPPAVRHHNLIGGGVAMTIFGVVLLFCGYRAMWWLWFPIAYMALFGQTISDRFMNIITFELQDIAARGSYFLFILMGVDVERAGNIITVFDDGEPKPLNIAEACSGMRMLMAFLALGVAMAYVGLSRFWQQIVLVLMAIPTAIFINMLRVVTLGLLSIIDADFAAGDFHTFIGLIWLVPAFLIYLGIMWVVRNLVVEEDEPKKTATANATKSNTQS